MAGKTQMRVTDHALIRYLERVRGFTFKKEIEEMRRICGETVNGRVKYGGCLFEIVDGCLITVAPDNGHPNATTRETVRKMNFDGGGNGRPRVQGS